MRTRRPKPRGRAKNAPKQIFASTFIAPPITVVGNLDFIFHVFQPQCLKWENLVRIYSWAAIREKDLQAYDLLMLHKTLRFGINSHYFAFDNKFLDLEIRKKIVEIFL